MGVDLEAASHYIEAVIASPSFAARYAALAAERGPFCLGLDPTPALLQAWGFEDDIWGLRGFCDRVIDATDRQVSVIKPQSAYFERFGAAGLEVLADVIESIHALGSLALLDVKRGDIGSTNEAYANALLGPDSAFAADAITVHAYLGFAALGPILERAVRTGCGVFVVVLSSNPEGRALQNARVASGPTVAEALCDEISAYNARASAQEPQGPVGAVVGLTADNAGAIAGRLPRSLVLAPGLGAQGGTFEQVVERFGAAASRVLPASSRGVLSTGPDPDRLARAIGDHATHAKRLLAPSH